MSLCVDDLPHFGDDQYRLRYAGCDESFPGATFKNGVTTGPVSARTARRLYQAFGASLTIEPWESPTPPPPAKGRGIGETPDAPTLPKKRRATRYKNKR